MIKAGPRSHWLLMIARAEGLCHADEPSLKPTTSLADAWRIIAVSGGITQTRLAELVAAHAHLVVADLSRAQAHATTLIPERLARQRQIFALRESESELVVASADPNDLEAEHLAGFASGRRVRFEIAPPRDIYDAIEARYAPDRAVERLLSRVGADAAASVEMREVVEPQARVDREAESRPITMLAHMILADALRSRASDVHVEPSAEGGRVRFRVDGVMQTYTTMPSAILNRVVSRLKIMGKMDIADHMRPQDGRARIRVGDHALDLRISTVPTRDAEKAVVRLLDPGKTVRLEDLSLTTAELTPLREVLGRRDGIVVVTGPTGSGKTTLLYAALREMPTGELNIMTVEDPIEYELTGLTQIQVEPRRDVTFATALKSILRQDPDVILVGEIRDGETAAIAVQASLTGHLVLASLHTNDAVGAIARLVDLGVERRAIASTFRGATAQRLIRRVCAACAHRITGPLSASELDLASRYGATPLVRAVGCAVCGQTGYFGRLPLLEILLASPALEAGILDGASTSALQAIAVASGMRPLRTAALDRVRSGETTLDEIDRELGEGERAPEEVARPGDDAATVPEPPSPIVAEVASGPHVLVAEDDAVTREVASALLRSNGYRVSTVADGAAALALIARPPHDIALLVLDLGLPIIEGQEVLRRLRAAMATASLPILVLTGATETTTEVEMMEAGADDYVRKPMEPERFIARVRAVLKRASLRSLH